MKWLKTIWLRVRSLVLRREVKREIDEELRFHLEQRTAENVAAGMSNEEAARAARRRFGNVQGVREECREVRGASMGETLAQDLRFAVRMLRKSPGFTSVAVLTLALGIGANTVIFSIVNTVLLRPLPYREPDRLVTVCESNPKWGHPQIVVSPANLRDWSEQNSVFEQLGGQIYNSVTLTGIERPEHLHAQWTTPNYFSILGVAPLLGRTFLPEDKPPGHRVVVLSHQLWQSNFGGDRNVVGRSITLSGLGYTVIGVMPRDFKIYRPAAVFGLPTGDAQPQLWMPYPGSMDERRSKYFLGFGRLKPGVTPVQAEEELKAIAARWRQEGVMRVEPGVSVQPLADQIVGGSRPMLRLLLGAVAFVLLIACVNVANLSLARSIARDKEFTIRAAVGASRVRLVRQMLVESIILASIGGLLGALLVKVSLSALTVFQSSNLPRLDEVQIDGAVLGFTIVVTVLTAVMFGLAPALQASKPNLAAFLNENARGSSDGPAHQRARGILIVAEVALAMILLTGAGLMLQSFARLTRVHPGFNPEQLMTFDFSPAGRDYESDVVRMNVVRELQQRVESQPGVTSVAIVYGVPFGTMLNSLVGAVIEGRPATEPRDRATAGWRVVSPNYFDTMGIPLLAGRLFSEKMDTPDSPSTVIVTDSFARKYFPGENPVGKRVQLSILSSNWHEVVGIISDVKLTGLDAGAMPEIYQSTSQHGVWMFSLVVRSGLNPREIERLVRGAAAGIDKGLPPFNVRTMDRAMAATVAPRRLALTLIGIFAGVALVLTIVGIYGVVSYSVGRRTREIGIRMALGASRRSVLSLMLRRGMMPPLIGLGIGLVASLSLTRFMASQLFDTSPTDVPTFAVVAILVLMIALVACWVPARRAAKVEPMMALRCE